MNNIPFIFFGTGEIAVGALTEMEKNGVVPAIVVSSPDAPAGRGRTITPSPVSEWATTRNIEVLKPLKLDYDFLTLLQARNSQLEVQVFVVIDYGKFLPKQLLDIPPRGVLNMHPSLLPRLRGPSPIRSAILTDEKKTGVTVMLVDEDMDHGPIVARRSIAIPVWPPHGRDLDAQLAREGGKLVSEIIGPWIVDDIEAQPQNHDVATFSRIFKKEDGLIDLVNGDAYQNLLKVRAFEGWPGTYTFFERSGAKVRAQIIAAHMDGAKLVLDTVKPEGKNEMSYADFARTGATIA